MGEACSAPWPVVSHHLTPCYMFVRVVVLVLDQGTRTWRDAEMCEDTYNGWTNRETWACALWLSNDPGWYYWATDTVREGLERRAEWLEDHPGLTNPKNDGASWAGEYLRDQFESFVGDEAIEMMGDAGEIRMMLDDIGSRWRIDWAEVARSFMDGAE